MIRPAKAGSPGLGLTESTPEKIGSDLGNLKRYIGATDRMRRIYADVILYKPSATGTLVTIKQVKFDNDLGMRNGYFISFAGQRETGAATVSAARRFFNTGGSTFGWDINVATTHWDSFLFVPRVSDSGYSFSPGKGGTVDFQANFSSIVNSWYISMAVFEVGA